MQCPYIAEPQMMLITRISHGIHLDDYECDLDFDRGTLDYLDSPVIRRHLRDNHHRNSLCQTTPQAGNVGIDTLR
jgi:hypothetical protein